MNDLRYACRWLAKSPAFAAVAVLTLALGIGANTAAFSIVEGVLLRPLPFADPQRLVMVLDRSTHDPGLSKLFESYADFKEFAAHSRSFESYASITWARAGAIMTGRGPAKGVVSVMVTDDFFATIGARAAIGRTFTEEDLARGCSVVLADAFWRGALGKEAIVGHSITLDRQECTVLGVMPAAFEFYPRQTQAWMLLRPTDPAVDDKSLAVGVGRLKRGLRPEQAQAEIAPLHQAIHRGDWRRDFTPTVEILRENFMFLAGRNLRPTLGVLFVSVCVILLIACINLANLLLGRLAYRERELTIRTALGAGRSRLIRQLMIEATLIAASGGALGIAIGSAALAWFRHASPIELPIGSQISIDVRG